MCVNVDDYKTVNVYKLPPTRLRSLNLPVFPHPCVCAGDFNCRHVDWGYNDNGPDGECLAGWASINSFALLYNAKDAASSYSGLWNTGTNPDVAFANVGPYSRLPDRRLLEKFPRSQHRPSLITLVTRQLIKRQSIKTTFDRIMKEKISTKTLQSHLDFLHKKNLRFIVFINS